MSAAQFEEEANPFQTDDFDHTPSIDSLDLVPERPEDSNGFNGHESVATLHQSQPSSPTQVVSPPPPLAALRTSFSPTQANNKVEFCCGRDQYLHSGDDVEIQVGLAIQSFVYPGNSHLVLCV